MMHAIEQGTARKGSSPRRLRVLLSAYACEPEKGSEPGVGWNWVKQNAKHNSVWVLTRASNREAILNALAREPIAHVRWVFLDLPAWARKWKRGNRGVHLYYYLWQLLAYFTARGLQRQVCFDVVHHVTFVNYWLPSFLPLLPVPFVWGPAGGGESAPPPFRGRFGLRARLYEWAREMAHWAVLLDPISRLLASRAALGLATTEETQRQMLALGCRRVLVYSEAGLSDEDLFRLAELPAPSSRNLRILSLGRLLHWKGFELGLLAFAQVKSVYPRAQYWIAGDGPERQQLERVIKELDLTDSVKLLGRVSRAQALELLGRSDVLLHPSLHDSGGWVCLEAMASGRPVVCLDLGGPAIQVTPETGIKIPAGDPGFVTVGLAGALLRLADPELRCRLGAAGRKRVQEYFAWDRKGEFLQSIYRQLTSQSEAVAVRDAELSPFGG
jgi:glycosyltransferase involved in cell wall biosynthesis